MSVKAGQTSAAVEVKWGQSTVVAAIRSQVCTSLNILPSCCKAITYAWTDVMGQTDFHVRNKSIFHKYKG